MNAKDRVTRLNDLYSKDKSVNVVNEIKVSFSPKTGEISIMNNGDGIDVAERSQRRRMGSLFIFLSLSLVNY